MNIGKAISFIFDDPEWWKKLLIGTLILLIPILGWFVIRGWWLEIIKRVAKDDPEPLPSFDNFGDLLTGGFRSFVVFLVYKSPIIILGTFAVVVFFIPFFITANGPSDDSVALLLILLLCGGLILFPLSIILGLFEKSAQMELAIKGELSEAFKFSKVKEVFKTSWGQLVLVLLISVVAFWVTQPIASAIILIGTLVVSVVLSAFNAHLYGQVYRKSAEGTLPTASVSQPDDPNVITL